MKLSKVPLKSRPIGIMPHLCDIRQCNILSKIGSVHQFMEINLQKAYFLCNKRRYLWLCAGGGHECYCSRTASGRYLVTMPTPHAPQTTTCCCSEGQYVFLCIAWQSYLRNIICNWLSALVYGNKFIESLFLKIQNWRRNDVCISFFLLQYQRDVTSRRVVCCRTTRVLVIQIET